MIKKTNIAILASMTLLLASCGGSGKIRDIVDFTPKLTAEAPGNKVILSAAQSAHPWVEGAGWINSQPHNFIAEISSNFAKHKVSKSHMVAAPLMAEGKIFTLSENGILSAIDITSSGAATASGSNILSKIGFNSGGGASYKVLWSADLKGQSTAPRFPSGGMTYHNGVLFLTHSTRDIIAYDASVGRELWRRRLPDVAKTQPVLYQNVAIIQTLNNQVYAMDVVNGKILWQHDGLPETLSTNRNITPIIHGGRVIVGYSSGQVFALNLTNGQELWQMNLSREGDILPGYMSVALESQPVVDGEAIYVASGNGFLLKINMGSGSVNWQRKVQDIQSMNKSGNTIFVTTNAKEVAALAADSGKVIWVTDLDPQVDGKKPKSRKPVHFLTPLLINNELIIVSSDGKMRRLSVETGEIIKTADIEKGAQFITVDNALNIFTDSNVLTSK